MLRFALTAVLLTTLTASGLTGCSHAPRESLELSASPNKTKAGLKVAQQLKGGKAEKAISLSDDPKDWPSPKESKPQADRTSIATSKVPVTRPTSTSLFGNDDPIFIESVSDRKRTLPDRPTVVTTTTTGPTEVRVIPVAQQRVVNESSPTIEFGERVARTAPSKPTRLTDSADRFGSTKEACGNPSTTLFWSPTSDSPSRVHESNISDCG